MQDSHGLQRHVVEQVGLESLWDGQVADAAYDVQGLSQKAPDEKASDVLQGQGREGAIQEGASMAVRQEKAPAQERKIMRKQGS